MSFTSLLQHVFYISFATCLLHLFCNMSCKCRGLSFMSLLRHVSVSLVLCLVCLFFDIGLSFFLSLACFVLYVSLALCLSSKCLFRCANEIYTDARHCARGIVLYSNMNVVSWGTYDWVTRRHMTASHGDIRLSHDSVTCLSRDTGLSQPQQKPTIWIFVQLLQVSFRAQKILFARDQHSTSCCASKPSYLKHSLEMKFIFFWIDAVQWSISRMSLTIYLTQSCHIEMNHSK